MHDLDEVYAAKAHDDGHAPPDWVTLSDSLRVERSVRPWHRYVIAAVCVVRVGDERAVRVEGMLETLALRLLILAIGGAALPVLGWLTPLLRALRALRCGCAVGGLPHIFALSDWPSADFDFDFGGR